VDPAVDELVMAAYVVEMGVAGDADDWPFAQQPDMAAQREGAEAGIE